MQNIYVIFSLLVQGAYSPERCQGIEIVDPALFYPVPWIKAAFLMDEKKTLPEWKEFFAEAYSVDFYRSSMKSDRRRVLKPQYYGAKKPAFSYLGPEFCPMSFHSETTF